MKRNHITVGVICRKREIGPVDIEFVPSGDLLRQPIYCPFCRRELKGWIEGCTIIQLYCNYCNIAIMLANTNNLEDEDVNSLETKLLSTFIEESSKW